MVELGAHAAIRIRQGGTLMHLVAGAGLRKALEWLLSLPESGAMFVYDNDLDTPLEIAQSQGQQFCCALRFLCVYADHHFVWMHRTGNWPT